MNRVFGVFILAAATLILAGGCSSSKTASVIERIPDWAQDIPQDPNFVFEVGTATSQDMQLAKDKAADAARLNIAKSLETRFTGLSKRFQEEVGTGGDPVFLDYFSQATKAVVSTTLTGVVTEKTKVMNEGGLFRAYVLLKLPVAASSQAILDKLKQQEEMYTRFRATEMFKDLEKEAKAFEDFRTGQAP